MMKIVDNGTFGSSVRIETEMIFDQVALGVATNSGYKLSHVRLPHQLYIRDLLELSPSGEEVVLIPFQRAEVVKISRDELVVLDRKATIKEKLTRLREEMAALEAELGEA